MIICCLSLWANWLLFNAWQQNQVQTERQSVPQVINPSKPDLMRIHLNSSRSQISAALKQWQDLQQTDPQAAQKRRQVWFAQVSEWLQQNHVQSFLIFLDEWQAVAPDSLETGLLNYYWHLKQSNLAQAADTLYPLLNLIESEARQTFELNKLYQLLTELMPEVLNQQACAQFIDTLEMLIWYDDSQGAYILALSQCYIQMEEYLLAEQQLIYLLVDPDYQQQASLLLAQMKQPPHKAVPLARFGDHFIVQARINKTKPVALMIDTGASVTSLSRQKFNQLALNYQSQGYQTMATAGGLTQAEIVMVERFSVGDKIIEPFQLAILDVNSFAGSDGLLGMNFLSRFPFTIDQTNDVLRFTDK